MKIFFKIFKIMSYGLFITLALIACEKKPSEPELSEGKQAIASLRVFKSPQCGCCGEWVDYMQAAGFNTQVTDTDALDGIKTRYNIPRQYQSCHTAVTDEGYIFEGHIPAEVIQRFLKEKPLNALGLSVPGMPVGSPGMEMGDKLMPYQVLLLMKDGSTQVYSEISQLSR